MARRSTQIRRSRPRRMAVRVSVAVLSRMGIAPAFASTSASVGNRGKRCTPARSTRPSTVIWLEVYSSTPSVVIGREK